MGFYKVFIRDVLNSEESVKFTSKEIKGLIVSKGKTVETIKLLSKSLKETMKKPQSIEVDSEDFYIGMDTYTSTIYICFSHLLMVDIDEKLPNLDEMLMDYTTLHPNTTFDVYETKKGFHIFDVSRRHDYTSDESLQMMLDLQCDFFYSIYSHIRGWSVRLNKKNGKCIDGDGLYTFYKRFGNGQVDSKLEGYVKMHQELAEHYAFTMFSKMR